MVVLIMVEDVESKLMKLGSKISVHTAMTYTINNTGQVKTV